MAYYWVLVLLFMASPSLGYLFSVLLELGLGLALGLRFREGLADPNPNP